MNKDKLIEEFEKLLNDIEKVKNQQEDYEETYEEWETVMENDIDGLLAEFYNYLEKEVKGDIE